MILALLLAAAAPAGDPCRELPAGPAEGMCIDEDAPKTAGMARLLPASHEGAPIPAELTPTIAVTLAAYDAGVPIPAGARTSDATDRFCARFATDCPGPVRLAGWQLPAGLAANAPYMLRDGRLRIEWMRGNALVYLSLISFRDGRIGSISTAPAEIPLMRR